MQARVALEVSSDYTTLLHIAQRVAVFVVVCCTAVCCNVMQRVSVR